MAAQLPKIFQPCMENEGSYRVHKGPATGAHTESDESNPHSHIYSLRYMLISSNLPLGLPSGLFPSGFRPALSFSISDICYLFYMPCPLHLDFIIIIPAANYESPRSPVLSSLMSVLPPWVQMFSNTPSVGMFTQTGMAPETSWRLAIALDSVQFPSPHV